jgi:hypothetical protein
MNWVSPPNDTGAGRYILPDSKQIVVRARDLLISPQTHAVRTIPRYSRVKQQAAMGVEMNEGSIMERVARRSCC